MSAKAAKGRVVERVAPLGPRLLDEEGAALYLGLAAKTLRNLRGETPPRLTEERVAAAMEDERIPPVPFIKLGRIVRYDVRALDAWVGMVGRLGMSGRLPEDGAPAAP